MCKSKGPILLAAGGTGGHLYPALALYQELKAQGLSALLVTDHRGQRFTAGFEPNDVIVLPSGGLVSGSLWKRAGGLIKLCQGWMASRKLLQSVQPVGVIGLGGYASAPPIIAASQMGIPSILKQGDAVLGQANRFLSGRVRKICLGFPDTSGVPVTQQHKIAVVGAPMRRDIEDRHNDPYAGPKATIRLLCVGGSLGAKAFSQLLPKALGNLKPEQRARFTLVQQVTDPGDRKRLTHEYQAMGLNAEIKGYINDMADQLTQADLVIARSGSTTVHEIAAVGRAAIFIPLGIHADAQQLHNARYLQQAGAAWIVPQTDIAASGLSEIFRAVLEKPEQLAHKADIAKSKAILGAAKSVVGLAKSEFNIA